MTQENSPQFRATSQRIARFDNDGTLWFEQPMYAHLAFALDRVKSFAPMHPEWREISRSRPLWMAIWQPLVRPASEVFSNVMVTHAGQTTDEFERVVTEWLLTARHPRFKRLYTELVYQPMIELLAYLRANGFKTFIVSDGGSSSCARGLSRYMVFHRNRYLDQALKRGFKCGEIFR